MSITSHVEVSGDREVIARLHSQAATVTPRTEIALQRAGMLIERNVKGLLSLQSHPPGTPTPSAPGEPPALVTGNLRRSVHAVLGPGLSVSVRSGLDYSAIQERGGSAGRNHSVTLPPRPYMAPGSALSDAEVTRILADAWIAHLRNTM